MKVRFLPQEIELEIEPNQTVMDLAHKNNLFIKSICNGVPNCAECRVKIVEGEHNVLPPSAKELQLIGSGHFIDRRRLSCQLYCFGDITVDVSEQVKKESEGPPGSRRFQVDLRNEGIVSKAVTGNLIQQDHELVDAVTQDVDRPGERSGRGQEKTAKPDPILELTKEGSGSSGKKSRGRNSSRGGRNRDNRNNPRRASGGKSGSQGGAKASGQGGNRPGEQGGGNSGGQGGNRSGAGKQGGAGEKSASSGRRRRRRRPPRKD